jgi:hypothetical protein
MHAPQAPFDVAVVGVDAIVRVALGSTDNLRRSLPFVLQFSNGCWIFAVGLWLPSRSILPQLAARGARPAGRPA